MCFLSHCLDQAKHSLIMEIFNGMEVPGFKRTFPCGTMAPQAGCLFTPIRVISQVLGATIGTFI
jgi:hypothetical protein